MAYIDGMKPRRSPEAADETLKSYDLPISDENDDGGDGDGDGGGGGGSTMY